MRSALKPLSRTKSNSSPIRRSRRPPGTVISVSEPNQLMPFTLNGWPLAYSLPSIDWKPGATSGSASCGVRARV